MNLIDNTIKKVRKTTYLTVLLLGISSVLFSQTRLTGEVTDTLNEPLAYVNVILQTTSKDIATGTITDEAGKFNLDVEREGDYVLEFSSLGYKTEAIKLDSTNQKEFHIKLEEDNSMLDEVVIEARKPIIEEKIDRSVFNISSSASASSGTANDALKLTPGVNYRDEKLSIAGKNEVRVLINDKMLRLSGKELHAYLNSIPSENIEKIEVITTPPAKYEAEGDSGLINIVLKKSKNDSWSNTFRSNFIQGYYAKYGLGDSFLYHKNKLEIAASLDANKGYGKYINDIDLYFDEGPWFQKIDMKEKIDNISGRFSIDYTPTEKSSLGIIYSGTLKDNDMSNNDLTTILNNDNQKVGDITSAGNSDGDGYSHDLSAYYKQELDTLGRKLSVDIDYFKFQNSEDRAFTSIANSPGLEDAKMHTENDQYIDNISASIDMDHPTDWAQITYGGKLLFTNNENRLKSEDFLTNNPDLELQKDHFKYKENVQALYFDFTKTFGEKWTAKAGLRYEHTQTEGKSIAEENDFKRNYENFFPTAFINYKADNKNTLNLSYSRRINRPPFWALNSFKWYINSISYSTGNPFLRPMISNNFELKHSFKNKLISKVFVSTENKGFDQIPSVDSESNQQIYTFDNYYKSTSFGITETFMYNPFKWWNSTTQATVSYLTGQFDGGYEDITDPNHDFNIQIYTNHNFYLNQAKTLQAEATFTYMPKLETLMFSVKPFSTLDIGVKALFLDKKLEASLTIQDIYKGSFTRVNTHTNDVKQVYGNYNDGQNIKLSVNYRFGNDNLKSKNQESKNKEIKERTN